VADTFAAMKARGVLRPADEGLLAEAHRRAAAKAPGR
jgi:hypothetical protein